MNTRPRKLGLDFFRGIALLIIFVNHIPRNDLARFTPSRFGPSDAAEIFVFLSGLVAALAYGETFRRAGLALGSVRVLTRCGQVYAAHIGSFLLLAAICTIGTSVLGYPDYAERLNIRFFFDETEVALLHLLTLRYVPNYFDILPMYLVVMLWIPLFWALSRVHVLVPAALSLGLYAASWWLDIGLSADRGGRPWFFNPFAWQLLFFAGFGFGAGWYRPLRFGSGRLLLAALIIVVLVPLGPDPTLRPSGSLSLVHAALQPVLEKTRCGPLRLLHFFALAYLASAVLRARSDWFDTVFARPIVLMGQHSLEIFVLTMGLSFTGGIALDALGRSTANTLLINASGFALLISATKLLAWFRSRPWTQTTIGFEPAVAEVSRLRLRGIARLQRIALGAMLASLAVVPMALGARMNGARTFSVETSNLARPSDDDLLANNPLWSRLSDAAGSPPIDAAVMELQQQR
ncbi:MAG: OpgC domain-containing protein [Methylotetracoccus sp.]